MPSPGVAGASDDAPIPEPERGLMTLTTFTSPCGLVDDHVGPDSVVDRIRGRRPSFRTSCPLPGAGRPSGARRPPRSPAVATRVACIFAGTSSRRATRGHRVLPRPRGWRRSARACGLVAGRPQMSAAYASAPQRADSRRGNGFERGTRAIREPALSARSPAGDRCCAGPRLTFRRAPAQ